MSVKGGNNPACAACKYQRRRCSSDCILAPYFPASQTRAFQNAHRLFGVANIMRILNQAESEDQKEEAMKSIKFEADMRARFPVHGCLGVITRLYQEIREAEQELQDVYEQLNIYRTERSIPASDISSPSLLSSDLQFGGIFNNSDMQLSATSQQTHPSFDSVMPLLFPIDEEYDDQSHIHLHLDQNESYYGLNGNNNNSINNFTAPSNIYQNFQNEMSFDNQSYMETKEASESSLLGSSLSSFREFQQPTSKNT